MAIATSDSYPSERQMQYACDLIDKKNLLVITQHFDRVNAMDAEEYAAYLEHVKREIRGGVFTKKQVSDMISTFLKCPDKVLAQVAPTPEPTSNAQVFACAQNSAPAPTIRAQEWRPSIMPQTEDVWVMIKDDMLVPRGSYGLETPQPNFTNDITFFSVWINDDGSRWTVRMWVSDERQKINRSLQYKVLEAIAENPAEAAACYGHNIGKCGICSRKLTNDESRARGIGPICAERFGW